MPPNYCQQSLREYISMFDNAQGKIFPTYFVHEMFHVKHFDTIDKTYI